MKWVYLQIVIRSKAYITFDCDINVWWLLKHLTYSGKISWGLKFTFFVIWAKSQKLIREIIIREIFSRILFPYKTGFLCDHGPVQVFSVHDQSRSLSDPKLRLSSTGRPQAIDSDNKKVSAILASDSSVKDLPSCSPYMKFSPEQTAPIARYAMESRNKRAILRLFGSGASISRTMQSGGWTTMKYCESEWSAVNTKCCQIVSKVTHCSLGKS